MFIKLREKLDKELIKYINYIDKRYKLSRISESLFRNIKDFTLRKGKRIRPILFICGYKGFSNKTPKNLFRCALSMEFLHDFLLVHDDIVDRSDTRRGKPTMHIMLAKEIKRKDKAKFTGEDLAIIIGDVMYAIAIESFLSIKEDPFRKEKALIEFIEAAFYTGCGEYIELLLSTSKLEDIKKSEIYKVYDYKTAYYTFVAPLVAGATLAGARREEIKKLCEFGINTGRAFQIKDDILGIFGDEKITGKSSFTDLEENKKTVLLWYAYNKATHKERTTLSKITNKGKLTQKDLIIAQNIIKRTGSLNYALNEIKSLYNRSITVLTQSRMKEEYKNGLLYYARKILIS